MENIDLLINPSWIIPIEPYGKFLEEYSIAVTDGKIIDILPSVETKQKYLAVTTHDLPDHVVLPGLVNAHTHSPMALTRGLGSDLPLMEWLNKYMWPVEKHLLDKEYIKDGTKLAIAEMISSGTTCFNEHYFFPEIISDVTIDAGMRAGIGGTILEFSTAWAENSTTGIKKSLSFIDRYKKHELIMPTFAPHAPYTLKDETLRKISDLAQKLKVPIHMHVHETKSEIIMSLEKHGKRPIQRLQDLGILDVPNLQFVHMTQIEEEDLKILDKIKPAVIHCPESNCKLASGYCPVPKLLDIGINVACGTDSAASNNDLNIIGEMKTAAMLAKGIYENPTLLPAATVLQMATLNGAKALGIDDKIGSLKVGKEADIISIDFAKVATQPIYDPITQLIYSTSRSQVKNVWVKGNQLLANSELTGLDETKIIHKAKEWAKKINLLHQET